jgi:hypothetical protein
MPELTGAALAWVIVGLVVGLIVEVLLFWAGCALADMDPLPGLFKTLLLVTPLYVLGVAGTWFAVYRWGFGSENLFTLVGGGRVIGVFVGCLAVNWIIAGLAYIVLLALSPKVGLFVAGCEMLLRLLMSALVTAVVLVALAGWQIYGGGKAPTKSELPPPPARTTAAA